MLFDVTAVLTTSAALGSVAEAFGVHEIARFATSISTQENVPAPLSLTTITLAAAGGAGSGGTVSDRAGSTFAGSTFAGSDLVVSELPGLPPQPFIGPVPPESVGATTLGISGAATSLASATAATTLGSATAATTLGSATSATTLGTAPTGRDGAIGSPAEVVKGTQLLGQIALLPVGQIDQFVRDNPEAIASLIGNPPRSQDVALWWGSMGLDARNALRIATPQLVGNLDGIPYQVRDLANRSVLTSTMRGLDYTIRTELGRTAVEKAKLQLSMLKSISNALGDASGNTNRTLMSLDVTGQGRAAIIVGDLETADYITYMVPGMFFTIEGQMVYWTDAAARLRDEQQSWLAHYGDTTSTVATVAWIGYHTPNLTNVGSLENAEEGRDSLARSIEGLQTLRSASEPYVTIVGHSYGSTAALMALTEYDFEVDALAVVGSPGSAAQSVRQLHVKNGNVFVGKAQWDPVPNSAFFGSEPGSASYGATTFGTDGGTDPLTGQTMLRSFFHIEYFSPATESLRNLALIGIGHGDDVTPQ